MEKHRLERLMRIARKTGAPLIVAGEENDFVLMDVEQYEVLVSGEISHIPQKNEIKQMDNEFPMEDEAEVPEDFFMPEAVDTSPIAQSTAQQEKNADDTLENEDFSEEQFYLEPIE